MEIKQLLAEDRAVSPVIGVILMVAITVILAAVIGTFVLGLGQNVSSSPSVSFSFDYNPNAATPYLAVTHEGGDSITQESTQHLDIVGSQSNLDSHIAGAQTDVGGGDDQNYWASSSSSNAVVDLTSNDILLGIQLSLMLIPPSQAAKRSVSSG